jgi:hypothetical protein
VGGSSEEASGTSADDEPFGNASAPARKRKKSQPSKSKIRSTSSLWPKVIMPEILATLRGLSKEAVEDWAEWVEARGRDGVYLSDYHSKKPAWVVKREEVEQEEWLADQGGYDYVPAQEGRNPAKKKGAYRLYSI